MEQPSQLPKSGELDNEENVPYGEVFDNAKNGKKESKSNQNDPEDFSKSEAPGTKGSSVREASQDESESWRSVDSPLQTSSMDKKNTVESFHQKRGGIRSGGNVSESEAPKGRYEQQLSREEGDLRRSSYDSPRHSGLSAGDTPKKATRQNVGSDRSVEQSPLHPQSQGRFGGQVTSSPSWERKVSSDGSHVQATRQNVGSDRSFEQSPLHPQSQGRFGGQGTSSPSWERKVSSEGSHGQATSTPGRSRLRSVTRGDETPDHGPAVPKFGEWDDNDPASAEGFTQIFTRVQEEKQTGGGRVPNMQNESLNTNGQMRGGYDKSKGCFCIPWGRR